MIEQVIDKIRIATAREDYQGKLFLVGGLLRDLALGIIPEQDIDIVCLGDAMQVAEHLHAASLTDHAPVYYPRFGTAMVTIDGIPVEFATARRESYHSDSRKPVVEPATLQEDVLRRDFTVNTLLRDLHSSETLDLTGKAQKDLASHLIRTPQDPIATFIDDPLRMLRGIRFTAKLNFNLDAATHEAIIQCAPRLPIISSERIRDELSKMLMLPRAADGLNLMRETTLLQQFAPELSAMAGVEQNIYHIYDVWDHTMVALKCLPPDASLPVRLGTLFHDIGKPSTKSEDDRGVHFFGHQDEGAGMTRSILQRLKYPNDIISEVTSLVSLHMRIGEYKQSWSDSAVRRLVRDLGDQMNDLFTICEADKAACNPEHHYLSSSEVLARIAQVQQETDYARVQSPLDGIEIMRITGLPSGKKIGEYKEALISEILEGRLSPKDKDGAETILHRMIEEASGS